MPRPPFYRRWLLLVLLALTATVGGCGLKGDLYLPDKGDESTSQQH